MASIHLLPVSRIAEGISAWGPAPDTLKEPASVDQGLVDVPAAGTPSASVGIS